MSVAAPLLIGMAFGWLLSRACLTKYDVIVGVYRFTDLTVLKFMLSALLIGAVLIQALVSLGLAGSVPVAPTYVAGNLLGGALLGIGMALAGFCPGTIVGGAGEGSLDYLIAGVAGLFCGALAFGLTYPRFFPWLVRIGSLGHATFASLLGAEPWLVLLLFGEIVLLLFYVLERGVRPRAGEP